MRIFLSAATENYANRQTAIEKIFQVIKDSNHTQTNPYPYKFFGDKKQRNKTKDVSAKVKHSIKKSDIIVAEMSIPSFGVGYNICLALYYNLPIICLCQKQYSYNMPSFIKKIKSRRVQIIFYTPENVEKLFKKSLRKAIPKKVRFNMNLEPEVSSYLNYLSRKEGKPRTEVIQTLIKEKVGVGSQLRKELDLIE